MLELRNVCKQYSSIPVVEGVSFCARAGEATVYLGPNGSGKSTTMKMITGLIEMSSGEILFDGKPIQLWDWVCRGVEWWANFIRASLVAGVGLSGSRLRANAHLSDDKTVAKTGHPVLWLREDYGLGRKR
jgi:ABC-type cobalamin/Fe3+-siderophores transport system ATPase subunit